MFFCNAFGFECIIINEIDQLSHVLDMHGMMKGSACFIEPVAQ